jgi:glucokinase
MILAGDIGGTKTNVGLFEVRAGKSTAVEMDTFPSRQYPGLEAITEEFLKRHPASLEAACFGVAGPVQNGYCKGVNLPWSVDAAQLSQKLEMQQVDVINDLEATAYSLTALKPEDFVQLAAGADGAAGNRGVIAAGTGLGEAGLFWDGQRHHPFACEGGHSDFGVRDRLEAEILVFFLDRYEHVSVERVISGPGLVDLYDFFFQRDSSSASAEVAQQRASGEAAAVISQAALEKRCPVCEQALDRFVILYGAEAGNLALKLLATGGIYFGGGIAPKIITKLQEPAFLEAFLAKGRMRYFMEAIPVHVIMTDLAALIGAAEFARVRLS